MKNIYNLIVHNKHLKLSDENTKVCFVGDNTDYQLKFEVDNPRTAMFAVFKRGLKQQEILLDASSTLNITLWCLKSGSFEVGLISDGFATTSVSIPVTRSIIDDTGQPTEDVPPGIAEQLIALVNELKDKGIDEEKVKEIVDEYLKGKDFGTDLGLKAVDGLLCVEMEGD